MPPERGHGALLRRTGSDGEARRRTGTGTGTGIMGHGWRCGKLVDGATSARSQAGIQHLAFEGDGRVHFHYAALG